MGIKYSSLITNNFNFPDENFEVKNEELLWNGIALQQLAEQQGTPLKITYLPQISLNINRAKKWFANAIKKYNYPQQHIYCYCTKSSHFKHIINEVLANNAHIETSSAIDINIVQNLTTRGELNKDKYIICNGFKRDLYIKNIAQLIEDNFVNCIPVLDNKEELNLLQQETKKVFNIGIRIAAEEEPKFEFYTSRLGIAYQDVLDYYQSEIKNNKQIKLTMLHFFINTGISDTAYYWNEFNKCLDIYVALKKICPSLNSLNIGGGFPIKDSLAFNFDYQQMVNKIVQRIKIACDENNVDCPQIFTEFGSFTVGESSANLYKILSQKQQNDKEKWYMINSSFITTLPDTWSISKRFLMLPLNQWNQESEQVLLGGLTCDSDDYYNSEKHLNVINLPKYTAELPLYIGFFNTGAYQDGLSGYGGIKHCLIPEPKHILIDKNKQGEFEYSVFREAQNSEDILKILGYE